MDGIFIRKKTNIWLVLLLLCGIFFVILYVFLNMVDSEVTSELLETIIGSIITSNTDTFYKGIEEFEKVTKDDEFKKEYFKTADSYMSPRVDVLQISVEGLLCGSLLGVKQVGGICGALLTNLSAWLSGIWFDLELVGGVFYKIAYALPFVHAVEMERAVLAGNFRDILPHLLWVLGYAVVTLTAAVFLFLRQMKKQ